MVEVQSPITEIETAVVRLRRLIGGFVLLHLAVTLPLWCDWGFANSPRIPWFEVFCGAWPAFDLIFFAVAVAACLWMGIGGRTVHQTRFSLGLFVSMAIGLVLLDQHRLQPWMLQFLVSALLLALLPDAGGLRFYRWFVCSIYFYSAFSKLDVSFLQSQGPMLLNGAFTALGISMQFWAASTKQLLSLLFPIGELIIAALLIWPRTRRIGLWSSVVMHFALLWTLGPLGLKHEMGVLCWNVFFILQNILLFRVSENAEVQRHVDRWTIQRVAAYCVTATVIICPILENWNQYDHWPAWAVYSSRPAQVRINIKEEAFPALPRQLRKMTSQGEMLDDSVSFNLDQWSFETRHCPLYPQLRYRLALAQTLLKDLPDDALSIEIRGTPDRWTGEREVTQLHGRAALERYCSQFRLNTKPL